MKFVRISVHLSTIKVAEHKMNLTSESLPAVLETLGGL